MNYNYNNIKNISKVIPSIEDLTLSGKVFFANSWYEDLLNDGEMYNIMKVPESDKTIILLSYKVYLSGGGAFARMYVDPTYTPSVDFRTIFNTNLNNTDGTIITLNRNPTVTNSGYNLLSTRIGSDGTNEFGTVDNLELLYSPWVLINDRDYCFELVNKSGRTVHTSIALTWLEL